MKLKFHHIVFLCALALLLGYNIIHFHDKGLYFILGETLVFGFLLGVVIFSWAWLDAKIAGGGKEEVATKQAPKSDNNGKC